MTEAGAVYVSPSVPAARARRVTLIDLLDRLLGGGVVVFGDITLAVADIDLVDLRVAVLVAAVEKASQP